MTPLGSSLIAGIPPPHPPLVAWRLDQKKYEATWDSGEGARLFGGRWNSKGRKIVYCALDPATAILEVAVHKGFKSLDTVPHVLTWFEVNNPADVFVVFPNTVPNQNWLRPGTPGAGQQGHGDGLLTKYPFVVIPSAVSTHSWNLLFDADIATGKYAKTGHEDFALDTRLHPPIP